MSVLDNVIIGQHYRTRTGIFGAIFPPSAVREEEKRMMEKALEILEFVGLAEAVKEKAKKPILRQTEK